jgi:protein pelota
MKVLKKDYKNNLVKVKVQTLDDLWYLSRIINKDDLVSGVTFRKISVSEKEGERRRVFLKIRVKSVDFQDFSNVLKVLGVIVESKDERVPIGEHHSFNLNINSEVTILKDKWMSVDLNYLKRSESRRVVNLMLVSCDYGDASFAFYHEYGVEYAGTLSEELGGKKELKSFEKNKEAFLKTLLSTINQIASSRRVGKVLIGGASMITDSLKKLVKDYDYLKNKTFFAKIGYSGKNGIKELIRKGEVDKLISDNVYSEQVKLVNKLLELIGKGGKATYGLEQVREAVEARAVKDLILTDDYIRKAKQEGKYAELDDLIQNAELAKAGIHIIPSNTEHGEAVNNLTGITVILRFKY